MVYLGITGVDVENYCFKHTWLYVPDEEAEALDLITEYE